MSKIKLVVTAEEKAVLERIASEGCSGIWCFDCPLSGIRCDFVADKSGKILHDVVAAKYLATCEVEDEKGRLS